MFRTKNFINKREILIKFIESEKAKRACSNCERKNCFINKYCSLEWKAFLTKEKTTFVLPAGEEIFSKGQDVNGIYSVYSGYIKVFEPDEKTERIVDLVTGGQILGYRGLGSSKSIYSVSARTLSECEITFFPLEIFNLAIKSNIDLTFFIIDLLSSKLKKVENRAKNFPKMQARDKIIYALNTIIETFGFDPLDNMRLKFTLSRKDIANIAVITYETTIRVLSELDKQKIIELDGKSIRIIEMEYFEEQKLKWNQ